MKTVQKIIMVSALVSALATNGFAQTSLQFTGASATPEHAIQLHWASNTNEVYEIDYADSLLDTNTGSITWRKLYDDYPSHGTNTFITDAGNYDTTPEIPHPKFSPMRFYRVSLVEGNTSASNPTVAVISPTNGSVLSGEVTFQVSAGSDQILSEVKLYIDGEEQWSSDDNSNFVINTCEWLNGNHTVFATAKSQSGLEGLPNGGPIYYGRAVSSYVNVTFDNLISGFDFSQYFFEPALGQTQQVTATFAANCDWTLQIQDVNSNTVRTVTGSGISMTFNWDGTGDGEAAIPDGVYTYVLSAQTNGQAYQSSSDSGDGGGSGNPPFPSFTSTTSGVSADSTELWAMPADGSGAAVPFKLYPPGFDTNNLMIFEASPSQMEALNRSISGAESDDAMDNGPVAQFDANTPSTQSTSGPGRKHKSKVKGYVGTFGICYLTYGTNGFSSVHPTTGWPPPLPTQVAIDNQGRTDHTTDFRILEYAAIASDFEQEMIAHTWKRNFLFGDGQWTANDIEKTSLGGKSIFNNCNFGLLMTHGSFGNNNSQGTEDDNTKYTYLWLGANNYVRLSDMDFGSPGTNGLHWMTILACSILKSENYNSMNAAGKIPVNENLHLLLGPSTYARAWPEFGQTYAHTLNEGNNTIYQAFNIAGSSLAHTYGDTNVVKFAISYWPNCFDDRFVNYHDPDPGDGLQYRETEIYPGFP